MNKLITWFVDNPIAANLLMLVILVGGYIGTKNIQKEVFPRPLIPIISIQMSYPGAAPNEVEAQLCVRIEEAIADLEGIYEITSEARQGQASVTVRVLQGYDADALLNDIKSRVGAVITFPASAEKPVIFRLRAERPFMYLALHGDASEGRIKDIARSIADGMSALPGISKVGLRGIRDAEMSIEISEHTLRRLGLSFDEVATAIRASSLNIPAGLIRSKSGDIQIQTRAQAFNTEDFGRIAITTQIDGSTLYLSDIANVKESFSEVNERLFFNDKRAVIFDVFQNISIDVIEANEIAKKYVYEQQKLLPPGMTLRLSYQMASMFKDRLRLLLDNAGTGLFLVFVLLMLFLRPLLAVWVCVGIATAFCGALFLLPYFDITLNMLSLFAFILVLGIVVDDAIIVGESIYTQQQQGHRDKFAAINGTVGISKPVTIAVLSTIIFFLPLVFVPETTRAFSGPIVYVVALCLVFSLIECFFILPSHLIHMKPEKPSRLYLLRVLSRVRESLSSGMKNFSERIYRPLLIASLHRKSVTISLFFVAFLLSLGVYNGVLGFSFSPKVPNDNVTGDVVMPQGTPRHHLDAIADRLTNAAKSLNTDEVLLKHSENREFVEIVEERITGSTVKLYLGLKSGDQRVIDSPIVAKRWRELAGEFPEALSYSLSSFFGGSRPDITFNLGISSNRLHEQMAAIKAVSDALGASPNVSNIRNNLQGERSEIELELKPHAERLGLSLLDIAGQVRQGFYGEQVQRIPRGKEDVRVMLRYSASERQSLDQLDEIRIRTKEGNTVPLHEVANVKLVPGHNVIRRKNRKRSIEVTAEVVDGVNANDIVDAIKKEHLSQWKKQFPGFTLPVDGHLQEQQEFMASMGLNFLLALFASYCLMAISFSSWWQPIVILSAIPFGFMGAIVGHLLMGLNLSMMSMLGFFACAGVVVNDNLVLLDRINRLLEQGETLYNSIAQAGVDRFRPIILTSVTTFVGVLPIMFEQSIQAKFLIPMAVSLAFGVLFATTITLILVPNLFYVFYRIGEVFKKQFRRLFRMEVADSVLPS